ncbi:protein YgfX [Tahibacter amnicola]|uniref:Toxin CptA n=1 Tax=Tahibacter amnicola TaxID=2976241 RepID=A0ABY6BFP6_9GAMM|nr:protein YgfX [Tahibacter amnicola]UXI66687.1 hypothetical protein N4264_18295 [Tahibacter amnicola]
MKSATALAFDYAGSDAVRYAGLGVCLLAIASLWLCAMPAPAAAIASILVVLVAWRHWSQPRGAPVRIAWREDGSWAWMAEQGLILDADLLDWRRLGMCLLLRLRLATGRVATVILTPDNLDRESRRRLLVRLSGGTEARGRVIPLT